MTTCGAPWIHMPLWSLTRSGSRRVCGTARAAPTATTSAGSAGTSTRRRATKGTGRGALPRRVRTAGTSSGSGGKASSRPTSRRSRSSSGIRLPQPVERARRPRLDRPATDAEHRGRLVLGELEEVPASDHEPLRVRQRVDGGEERLALLAREECRLGGGGRLPRGALRSRPQGQRVATRARAAAVASLVRDDLQEPGPERLAGTESVQRAVGLHERVLGSVLRLGGVSDDEVGDAEGDALVCVHEFSVGVLVAALRPFDELRLIEWPAHHRRYYTGTGSGVPAARLRSPRWATGKGELSAAVRPSPRGTAARRWRPAGARTARGPLAPARRPSCGSTGRRAGGPASGRAGAACRRRRPSPSERASCRRAARTARCPCRGGRRPPAPRTAAADPRAPSRPACP